MFVLLALVFAGGFVFFGVGSGSNGAGSLSDLFNNLFNGGSSGPSISKAQKEIQKDPRSAKGWKDLATAYETKGETDQAISAWETYTNLRPKDTFGLTQLAGLAKTRADNLQNEVATQQYQASAQYNGSTFSPSNPAQGSVGTDPFAQAVQSQSATQSSQVQSQLQSAYQSAIGAYQKLAKVEPTDATVQLELAQTAQTAGQTTVAVAAYKKVAKLLPARAAEINKLIKQLQPASQTKP